MKEEMKLEFDAISENEGLARVVIAAFLTRLDPTLEQLQDVKTAVSEAVTNAVIHGYEEKGGKIQMTATLENGQLSLSISDKGVGIENVQEAMQPLFTTRPEGERSGMGFSFMEAFMDRVEVESSPGNGTIVHMWKSFQENILSQSRLLSRQV
ncbi:MAG: anti-sigma F factor [Lachnospiraceae bacterium]|nr:anti-sigma F factor [Lachnospiraceae bacterium]